MVENGLVNFDQKTGGKALAFGFGETSQGMDIVAFPLISQVPHHRWTDSVQIDAADTEIPQEMIVLDLT